MPAANRIDTFEAVASYLIYRLKKERFVGLDIPIQQLEQTLLPDGLQYSNSRQLDRCITAIDELRLANLTPKQRQFLSDHILKPSCELKARWQCLRLAIFPKLFRNQIITWDVIVQLLEFLVQSVVVAIENGCNVMVVSMVDWATRSILSYSMDHNDMTVFNWITCHGGWEELFVKNQRRKNYQKRKKNNLVKKVTLKPALSKKSTKMTRGRKVAERLVKRAKFCQKTLPPQPSCSSSTIYDKAYTPRSSFTKLTTKKPLSSNGFSTKLSTNSENRTDFENDEQIDQDAAGTSEFSHLKMVQPQPISAIGSCQGHNKAHKVDESLCFCGIKKTDKNGLLYGRCSDSSCNWRWCFVGDCKFETESSTGIELHMSKHKEINSKTLCSHCNMNKATNVYELYELCDNCGAHRCLIDECGGLYWSYWDLFTHQTIVHSPINSASISSIFASLPSSSHEKEAIYPWKVSVSASNHSEAQCQCGEKKSKPKRAPQHSKKCRNCGRLWCLFPQCQREFSEELELEEHLKEHQGKWDIKISSSYIHY